MTTQVKTKVTTGQGYEIDVVVVCEHPADLKLYWDKIPYIEIVSVMWEAECLNSSVIPVDILPVLKATGHFTESDMVYEVKQQILNSL